MSSTYVLFDGSMRKCINFFSYLCLQKKINILCVCVFMHRHGFVSFYHAKIYVFFCHKMSKQFSFPFFVSSSFVKVWKQQSFLFTHQTVHCWAAVAIAIVKICVLPHHIAHGRQNARICFKTTLPSFSYTYSTYILPHYICRIRWINRIWRIRQCKIHSHASCETFSQRCVFFERVFAFSKEHSIYTAGWCGEHAPINLTVYFSHSRLSSSYYLRAFRKCFEYEHASIAETWIETIKHSYVVCVGGNKNLK